MTAYKLADELENLFNRFLHPHSKFQDFLNAATMLRQQADRIAELERTLSIMEGEYPEPTIFAKITEFNSLEEAYKRIVELEKALTQYRIENFIDGEYGQTITLAELRKTELYHNVQKQLTKPTHPVKQLSKERIDELVYETNLIDDYPYDFVAAIIKEITE